MSSPTAPAAANPNLLLYHTFGDLSIGLRKNFAQIYAVAFVHIAQDWQKITSTLKVDVIGLADGNLYHIWLCSAVKTIIPHICTNSHILPFGTGFILVSYGIIL